MEFGKYRCHIKDIQDHYRIVATGFVIGGLYKLDMSKSTHQALESIAMTIEEIWHQRYGNINQNDLCCCKRNLWLKGFL